MIDILISYGLLMLDNITLILFPYVNFLKGKLPSIITVLKGLEIIDLFWPRQVMIRDQTYLLID